MDFGRAGGRRVVADFDGGVVSSDAGALLLGETDKAIGLTDRFAACFADRRSPLFTVHPLKALIAQRVFGLALGYEDLNVSMAPRFSSKVAPQNSPVWRVWAVSRVGDRRLRSLAAGHDG
jgi:hypothetical protein